MTGDGEMMKTSRLVIKRTAERICDDTVRIKPRVKCDAIQTIFDDDVTVHRPGNDTVVISTLSKVEYSNTFTRLEYHR